MKKIKIAISGCMGRMGQELIKTTKSKKDFKESCRNMLEIKS